MGRAWSWAALAIYAVAIVVLATDPQPVAGGGAHDKLWHGVAYAVFYWLAHRATGGRVGWSMTLAVLHGGGVELAQRTVEGRHGSVGDFAADLVGALVGLAAVVTWRLLRGGDDARPGEA